MQSCSSVCALDPHRLPPLTLKAGRQNKKEKDISETFLGVGAQWWTRGRWAQLIGRA